MRGSNCIRAVPVDQVVEQRRDRDLDQVDAGRFERLEESAREADGDAVAIPRLAAPAGREPQRPRIGQRLAVEPRQQLRGGLVVADEVAAVDVAVADAVLQRNAPLPARLARRGARVGRQRPDVLAGHRHGAIAGQPAWSIRRSRS